MRRERERSVASSSWPSTAPPWSITSPACRRRSGSGWPAPARPVGRRVLQLAVDGAALVDHLAGVPAAIRIRLASTGPAGRPPRPPAGRRRRRPGRSPRRRAGGDPDQAGQHRPGRSAAASSSWPSTAPPWSITSPACRRRSGSGWPAPARPVGRRVLQLAVDGAALVDHLAGVPAAIRIRLASTGPAGRPPRPPAGRRRRRPGRSPRRRAGGDPDQAGQHRPGRSAAASSSWPSTAPPWSITSPACRRRSGSGWPAPARPVGRRVLQLAVDGAALVDHLAGVPAAIRIRLASTGPAGRPPRPPAGRRRRRPGRSPRRRAGGDPDQAGQHRPGRSAAASSSWPSTAPPWSITSPACRRRSGSGWPAPARPVGRRVLQLAVDGAALVDHLAGVPAAIRIRLASTGPAGRPPRPPAGRRRRRPGRSPRRRAGGDPDQAGQHRPGRSAAASSSWPSTAPPWSITSPACRRRSGSGWPAPARPVGRRVLQLAVDGAALVDHLAGVPAAIKIFAHTAMRG
ncbi:hypothetical protein [Azospirillum sp. A23]|uniref:hypothetical protein n=1 Tax=Azospirillum sp. A23 TaxID=3160608 RepID=UPI0036F1F71F